MKSPLLLFFLTTCSINAFCQSILIDGYINNTQGSLVTLSIDRNYLGINPQAFTTKTSDGSFSFTLNESKECIANLSYNGQSYSLFLAPKDTLHAAFTTDLMDITMHLSGNAAAENLFLKSFNKKFAGNFTDSTMDRKMLSAASVDAFEIDIYDSRKKQMEFFKSDSSFNSFSPAFKTYFTNMVSYRYWGLLFAYPIVRASSSTAILKVDELPAPLLDGFEKVKVNNADALISASYRYFLKYYVIYSTSKQNDFNKFTDYNFSMEKKNAFAEGAIPGVTYQYWLSKFILDDYEKAQPSTVKRLYNDLLLSNKQSVYASIVKERCGAYMEKKDEVKTFKGANGSTGNENYKIVSEKGKPVKFSDFKGKVVYVDFWASWCGPCRGEMPHSKELHHQFTEKQLKNIVFLYISIDNGEAAWRKAVEEIGMEGVNAWSAASLTDGAGAYFNVSSIPRYMLIDKSGKIVDDNAKRPSDPAAYSDILNLLQ